MHLIEKSMPECITVKFKIFLFIALYSLDYFKYPCKKIVIGGNNMQTISLGAQLYIVYFLSLRLRLG